MECRIVVFKQKTAYELRISDWSSDVCSSDLRYMLVADKTFIPVVSASVYEVSYSLGNRRFKSSIRTIFYHLAFLFTWAGKNGVDIEVMLLEGRGIDFKNVRSFARWLEIVILTSKGGEDRKSVVEGKSG